MLCGVCSIRMLTHLYKDELFAGILFYTTLDVEMFELVMSKCFEHAPHNQPRPAMTGSMMRDLVSTRLTGEKVGR
jgi:hypothetical protein